MEFPRQEYWSGLLSLSPGDLPDPGIKPEFLALQADSLSSQPPWMIHLHETDKTIGKIIHISGFQVLVVGGGVNDEGA